jgi:hypothetical protein
MDSHFISLVLSEPLAIQTFVCPGVLSFVFPKSRLGPRVLRALFLPDHFILPPEPLAF